MEQINSIISSPAVSIIILIIKIIFIIISLILFAAIIVLLSRTDWLKFSYYERYTEFFASRPFGKKAKFQKFEMINKRLESGKGEDLKVAVIEAENYLKEVLQRMGYKGDSMDEILDQADKKVLPSLDKIKEVQKVRDSIIHNSGYELSKDQAKNIVKVYEQALTELEAL